MPDETVLVVNSGSSSLKYELRDATSGLRLGRGIVSRIGHDGTSLRYQVTGSEPIERPLPGASYAEAIAAMFGRFDEAGARLDGLVGAGHRVVHGGTEFSAPVVVDDDVLARIDALSSLAPLHNPVAVECIRLMKERDPQLPQVAVFDTAFHATLPWEAYSFAIPQDLAAEHQMRRYGFHGTSVEYVTGRTAALLGIPLAEINLIVCHLGNGASITAVEGGRSVDTSMGFTPLSGLVMGTRAGDFDASAVMFLQDSVGMTTAEVATLLERRSGLLGLTGDSDMAVVRDRAERGDEDALAALRLVAYRIRQYIGAYLATVPGVHAVVFTAGIGENDADLRQEVCGPLGHLGLEIDPERNTARVPDEGIVVGGGPIRVAVVPTDEEAEIAHHTVALVRTGSPARPGAATDHPEAKEHV
ncbi:acetate/propionate family kinase [Mumia zhuanghuii]|uniref:Acetate kinase n=1 Tax=Mumia zhuanghuii TaxID=2585211 RepID=A0A5C4MAD1_9ACTN|nr:acetate kinase [Mumia zhuanghuii]TNC30495.1 acetate kinase [Mumia zhuanghuii]TNC48531.1 acetate kinase [Mumia zhuanghuii]